MSAIFSFPSGLWLLALAPVIVLLHTLKFRPKQIVVPSLRLWCERVSEPIANTFWQKIRKWRELSMQLFALLCFALALAGLRIPNQGEPPRELLIVLDATASMQALTDGSATRFERALAQLTDQLESSNPSDRFGLVVLDPEPRTVVQMGASAPAVLLKLEDLRVSNSAEDPGVRTASLIRLYQWLNEDAGMLVITGPMSSQETRGLPAKIALRTVGDPVPNRGITSALFSIHEGKLRLSFALWSGQAELARDADAAGEPTDLSESAPLLLERISGGERKLISAARESERFPHFDLGAPPKSPLRLRARFERSDAFSADNQVELLWEPAAMLHPRELLAGLELSSLPESLQRYLSILGVDPAANEREGAQSAERLVVLAATPDPADEERWVSARQLPQGLRMSSSASGNMSYQYHPWWENMVLEDFSELAEMPALEIVNPAWKPLLFVGSKPVAALREFSDGTATLVVMDALLGQPGFDRSDTFLTLFARWFAHNQEALHPRTMGVLGSHQHDESYVPALLSISETQQVTQGQSYDNALELPPGKGARLPLELAPWLLFAGLFVIALEWWMSQRTRRVRKSA